MLVVVGNNESVTTKNAGNLLAILIAMRMRQYAVGSIAGWSMPRASLGATGGSRHRVSACTVLPQRPP